MSKSLICSMLGVVWAIACGETTNAGDPPTGSAGSSAAGSNAGGASGETSGGSSSAGSPSAGSAGKGGSPTGGSGGATGGDTSGGVTSGGMAGSSAGGSGGQGGSGGVDSRCPRTAPMGACTQEQTEALCEYDSSGCLCSPTGPAPSLCARVDPTCPSGGAANAPAPDPAGGSSSKIALPTTRLCRCSGGSWQCSP